MARDDARRDWHSEPTQERRASALFAHVAALRSGPLQGWRQECARRMRLYAGKWELKAEDGFYTSAVRFNIVKMCVDTGVAMLCSARSLPYNQTRGAKWDVRRRAAKRTRAQQTQFQAVGVFDESQEVIRDAVVTGLGALRVLDDPGAGGTVTTERGFPLAYAWNPAEALFGMPRELVETKVVDRALLQALYPSKRSMIGDASGPDQDVRTDFQLNLKDQLGCDHVMVHEVWRSPSAKGAKDGVHALAVNSGMLVEGRWDFDRPPVAFLRGWQPAQLGLVGTSITELVEAGQERWDELTAFITKVQKLVSGPRIFLPNGSGLAPDELNNLPASVMRVTGDAPVLANWEATPNDLVMQGQSIVNECLMMLGLNQMGVQGQLPQGLESGRAMRTYAVEASKRHVPIIRAVERYYLDTANALADANDRLSAEVKEYELPTSTRKAWLSATKWSELSVDGAGATTAVLPISSLAGSPAQQQDTLAGWINQGWVSPEMARLLEVQPDTEAEVEEMDLAEEVARDAAEDVMDGKEVSMDPMVPPEKYLTAFLPAYYQAVRDEAPLLTRQRLQLILEQARAAVEAAQAQAQPPMPAAPAPGPAIDPAAGPAPGGMTD